MKLVPTNATPSKHLPGFVAAARHRVAAGFYHLDGDPLASHGCLTDALPGVIAELKPRSPSAGRLLRGDAAELLDAYRRGGACALSVLTDRDHFDGDIALLRLAHATGLPTMMKDFIVAAAQIECAVHHGAAAVLLIERIFEDPAERERLVATAHRLGLQVLLEVHGEAEAARAADSKADVLGVNARNLDDLQVDTSAALRVVARLAARGRPVVALSGISAPGDARRARQAGASGLLVGTSLMASPRPHLWLRALQRPLAKVCGIRDPSGLQAAVAAGADLVGFVVAAPDSPRNVTPAAAARLCAAAHSRGVATVLVTPATDPDDVATWARQVRPDFVQLQRLQPDAAWLQSLRDEDIHAITVVAAGQPPPASPFLVDHTEGGTGQVVDWDAARATVSSAPEQCSLLAGGLEPGNVEAALRATGAWGADASSRLEAAPGIKDPRVVAAFVRAVQEAR